MPTTLDDPGLRPTTRVVAAVAAGLVALIIWAGSAGSAPSQPPGDEEAGAVVYSGHCAMCHGGDATGMMGMHPALRGAVDRLSLEGVEVAIRNGRSTTPPMPAFGDRLSDDEIDNVIAYVAGLPDGPRNFGPGSGSGMGRGMMDGMMDGGPGWMFAVVVTLAAALAGVIGYLIGSSRRDRNAS